MPDAPAGDHAIERIGKNGLVRFPQSRYKQTGLNQNFPLSDYADQSEETICVAGGL